jgi:hypothetical protein
MRCAFDNTQVGEPTNMKRTKTPVTNLAQTKNFLALENFTRTPDVMAARLCKAAPSIFGNSPANLSASIKKHPVRFQKIISEFLRKTDSIATQRTATGSTAPVVPGGKITLFTAATAAREANVPESTFRKYAEEFNLQPAGIVDGKPAYDSAFVARFARDHKKLAVGRELVTLGFRQEGEKILSEARQFISGLNPWAYASTHGTEIQPSTQKGPTSYSYSSERDNDLEVIQNGKTKEYYRNGKLVAKSTTNRDPDSKRERIMQENILRQKTSAERAAKERLERHNRNMRKLKGLE